MKGVLFWFFTIFALSMMMAGQAEKQSGNMTDFKAFVLNNITANTTQVTNQIQTNDTSKAFNNIILKTAEWATFSSFELGKWSLMYGYEHPQTNYHRLFLLTFWLGLLGVFYPALPLLLGLVYLFYLVGKWIVQKYWQNHPAYKEDFK